MGLYLGTNKLGGGGGGDVQLGEKRAIARTGTHTNDPATNYVIDYDDKKWLRTGIQQSFASDGDPVFPFEVQPLNVSNVITSNKYGDTVADVEPAGIAEAGGLTDVSEFTDDPAMPGAVAFMRTYNSSIVVHDTDATHLYVAVSATITGSSAYRIVKINKTTKVASISSQAIYTDIGMNASPYGYPGNKIIDGKAGTIFAGKLILVSPASNVYSNRGIAVLNKSNLSLDTGFNTSFFSGGKYNHNAYTSAYSGNRDGAKSFGHNNSPIITTWMYVNSGYWRSSTGKANNDISGEATFPTYTGYQLRYVTMFTYQTLQNFTAFLDHATGSHILCANNALTNGNDYPVRFTLGTSGETVDNANASNFSGARSFLSTTNNPTGNSLYEDLHGYIGQGSTDPNKVSITSQTYGAYTYGSWDHGYTTAAQATAALDAANAANPSLPAAYSFASPTHTFKGIKPATGGAADFIFFNSTTHKTYHSVSQYPLILDKFANLVNYFDTVSTATSGLNNGGHGAIASSSTRMIGFQGSNTSIYLPFHLRYYRTTSQSENQNSGNPFLFELPISESSYPQSLTITQGSNVAQYYDSNNLTGDWLAGTSSDYGYPMSVNSTEEALFPLTKFKESSSGGEMHVGREYLPIWIRIE